MQAMLDNLYYRRSILISLIEFAPHAGVAPSYARELRERCSKVENSSQKEQEEVAIREFRNLRIAVERIAKQSANYTRSQVRKKLAYLNRVLSLSKAESQLLLLGMLNKMYDVSDIDLDDDNQNFARNIRVLAKILRVPKRDLSRSLSERSILFASRMCNLSKDHHPFDMSEMDDTLLDVLLDEETKPVDVFKDLFDCNKKRPLPYSWFSHITEDEKAVRLVLEEAFTSSEKGINILFYGPPGTGKTAFAYSLLREVRAKAITIKEESDEKEIRMYKRNRNNRIGAYKLCQTMYAKHNRMGVVFDEADSTLGTEDSFFNLFSFSSDKSSIIALLEKNTLPTIWIVNNTTRLDDAVKRRFSCSLAFAPLEAETIARILYRQCRKARLPKAFVSNETVTFVQKEGLSIWQATLALTRTGEMYRSKRVTKKDASVITRTLLSQMRALSQNGRRSVQTPSSRAYFNESFLNVSVPSQTLVHAVSSFYAGGHKNTPVPIRNLNILFHGVPGTGKSEFARHLAERAGVNVIMKNASDLIDKYVGETEKRIAAAFDEAERTKRILVLDEADTFFRTRGGAHRGFEVSMVNEILSAMESFTGVLVATTNAIDTFDTASLRRFAYKVRFDTLSDAQLPLVWKHFFGARVEGGATRIARNLRTLRALTPGDFKAVYTQTMFEERVTADDILSLLAEESRVKQATSSAVIGF